MTPPHPPEGAPSSERTAHHPWAGAVAVVILVGFLAFVVALIVMRNAPEIVWGRLIWVFSAVEAVAFGAAGFLFGSTVHRQRAEDAEADAQRNAADAENGRRLAASAEAVGVVAGAGDSADPSSTVSYGPRGDGSGEVVTSLIRSHVQLAERLFPR